MPTHALSTRTRSPQWRFGILDMIGLWRQRRALASLDPERLDDVGITPGAARAEASRPFWDVPNHWRG